MKQVEITIRAEYNDIEKHIIPSHIIRRFKDDGFDHVKITIQEINKEDGEKPKPFIVCAANKHKESNLVVAGARHFDTVMRAVMHQTGGFPYWNNCIQGFIDQYNNFYTREEALEIAKQNNQIVKMVGGGERQLYSEMLY